MYKDCTCVNIEEDTLNSTHCTFKACLWTPTVMIFVVYIFSYTLDVRSLESHGLNQTICMKPFYVNMNIFGQTIPLRGLGLDFLKIQLKYWLLGNKYTFQWQIPLLHPLFPYHHICVCQYCVMYTIDLDITDWLEIKYMKKNK